MSRHKKPFFKPRVGKHYAEGFEVPNTSGRYKTLILGAYHVCTDSQFKCEYKKRCCSKAGIWDMDNSCPYYESQRKNKNVAEYFVLSNSDTIEMDGYLNEEDAPHATYREFTRQMLRRESGHISCEERRSLWEYVIFHNFLQHFVNTRKPIPYSTDSIPSTSVLYKAKTGLMLYNAAIPALVDVLKEYKPLYIYVWGDPVKECLLKNKQKIRGLKYEGEIDVNLSSTKVYLFSYNRNDEPLPFPVINNVSLKEIHVVCNRNIYREETTIDEILANNPNCKYIYQFFKEKRNREPSVEWFNTACRIFNSLLEMEYLKFEDNKFKFSKDTCSYYAKRMMFTLVIGYLGIKWNDLYSIVTGNNNLETAAKDKSTNIEKILESFYVAILDKPVPEEHALKKFMSS